jgi:hypothetical protein
MNLKKEVADLARILINSTCAYTACHISNEKNRFAYVRAMSRCLAVCSEKQNRGDTMKMREELLKIAREASKTLKPRFELFSRSNRYYMLGVYQALNAVESINTRFEKGYSSADEWFVRQILDVPYED